jgi:hypothetical protein
MMRFKKNNQTSPARPTGPTSFAALASILALSIGAAVANVQADDSSPVGSTSSTSSAPSHSKVSSSSGDGSYAPGEKVAFAALGLFWYSGGNGNTSIPPINLGLDWGLKKNFTVGGTLGFARSSEDLHVPPNDYSWSYTYVLVAARGTYHFPELLEDKQFDPYVVAEVGQDFVVISGSGSSHSNAGSSAIVNGAAGCRYWFNPNFAAQLELGLGFGVALFNLGLAYHI